MCLVYRTTGINLEKLGRTEKSNMASNMAAVTYQTP